MTILLIISILFIVLFIYSIYTFWKNKDKQNEDKQNEDKQNKEKFSFPMIMNDFKHVRVYHNIDPHTIAEKYNIKQTQFSKKINHAKQEHYELGFVSKTENIDTNQQIPRYIFQTWKTSILEKPLFENTKKWFELNPEYSYFLFNDTHVENFIRIEFGERILRLYQNLLVGALKADVWRLMVMYCYGGIYFDIDSELKEEHPFRTWGFGDKQVITGKGSDGAPHQWGLIYTPGHPIIKKSIERVLFQLYHQCSNKLLQIAYYPYVNTFLETPQFTEGWKNAMNGKVVFMNQENKKTMLSHESHWQTKTKFFKNNIPCWI